MTIPMNPPLYIGQELEVRDHCTGEAGSTMRIVGCDCTHFGLIWTVIGGELRLRMTLAEIYETFKFYRDRSGLQT